MGAKLDAAKAVRPGEELDLAKLTAWLARELPAVQPPLQVTQFPRGFSNLTYLVKGASGPELVLRRPPFGARAKAGHDMGREHRILTALAALPPPGFPLAPKPLARCDDPSVLGAPFYAMERLQGVILRGNSLEATIPEGLPPERKRALDEALIDALAALHLLDVTHPALAGMGKAEGYAARQVRGWTERYAAAKTDEIEAVDRIEAWLAAHLPGDSGAALLHNDYKFDNVLLDAADPTRLVGILDWEMSTVGDPLVDLGTTLAWWVEEGDSEPLKAFSVGPSFAPGSLTRRQLAERWSARTGRDISGLSFHVAFSLFKNAVIAQQIYARWKLGLTKDERFGALIHGVKLLSEQALQVAETGAY